jgi:uncharacterized protein
LKCPKDKSDMIVVEHRRVELDYCLHCSGVWFDSGELELLIQTLAASPDAQAQREQVTFTPAAVSEAKRRCPICSKRMDKVWIGKEPRVLIDRCPRGDGLWFDGGELRQVLTGVLPGDTKGIIAFLGDAFSYPAKPEGATDATKEAQ